MLARQSLLIFATNAVGALFGLVGLFFVGRYMSPEALGMLAFALSLVGIFALLADLGLDTAHVKRVSAGLDLGTQLATYRRLKLALTIGFALVTLGALSAWERTQGFTDAVTFPILAMIIVYAVAQELRKVGERTFTGLRQTAKSQVILLVEHVVKTPAVVAVALLYGFVNGRWVPFGGVAAFLERIVHVEGPLSAGDGAFFLAIAYVLGILASLAVTWFILQRHRYPSGRYSHEVAREYAAFGLPIAIFAALSILATRIDSVMIGYFWSAEDVGWYFAAQRIMTMLIIIPTAVRTVFFPLISELAARGERDAVREVATTTQRLVGILMVLGAMLLVVFPREIIHVFMSNSFLPGAPVLQLLALWGLVLSYSSVASSIVMGFGRVKAAAAVGSMNMLVNMALNLLFVPTSILGVPLLGLRAPGAALATLIAQTLHLIVISILARRETGSSYLTTGVVKQLLAGLVAGGILHLLAATSVFGGQDRVWELGAAALAGVLLYVAALYALRGLTRRDILLFIDLFHPGKMAAYVKKELGPRRG